MNSSFCSVLSRGMFVVSAAIWAATILFVPSWWGSPALDSMGLADWMAGAMWAVSGLLLARTFWPGASATTLVAGLAVYAVPTTSAGCSIVWWTVQENLVSAMGSAVAWLSLGVSAMVRAVVAARAPEL